jgi:hypothetical protein
MNNEDSFLTRNFPKLDSEIRRKKNSCHFLREFMSRGAQEYEYEKLLSVEKSFHHNIIIIHNLSLSTGVAVMAHCSTTYRVISLTGPLIIEISFLLAQQDESPL